MMKEIINNDEGQALFEMFIFLPLLISVYAFILVVGNAINASINQQKITRSYFYYRLQNDPTLPKKIPSANPHLGWRFFGSSIMGWRDYLEGDTPVAPCYKITLPLDIEDEDACDKTYKNFATSFIRIQTVYGVCGTSYSNLSGKIYRSPREGLHELSGGTYPCTLVQ